MDRTDGIEDDVDETEDSISPEENEKLMREVGSFSFKAIQRAKDMIKPGVRLLEVAEALELFVKDNGFDIAFPINLSVNSEAAHYTPTLGDSKVFGESDLVKVDFGAGKQGVLGDCAVSVDISGNYQKLIESTERALSEAISIIKPGVRVRDIGKRIDEVIRGMGCLPIKNLGGHGVRIHELHSDPFIPNFDNGDDTELVEGDVIAIEPFATTDRGRGYVGNSDTVEIFSLVHQSNTRSANSRKLLDKLVATERLDPFAARWFGDLFNSKFELYAAIGELVRNGALESHPMLIELGGGIVSQHEAEVVVRHDGCDILTI